MVSIPRHGSNLHIQTIHAVLKFSAPTYIHYIDNILIVNTWVLKQVSTPSVSADAQAFSTRPPGCSDFIQVTATYWQPPRDTCYSASVWWRRVTSRAWGEEQERPKDSGKHPTMYIILLLLQTSFIQIHDSNPQFADHTVDDTPTHMGSTQQECLFTLMNIQSWWIFMIRAGPRHRQYSSVSLEAYGGLPWRITNSARGFPFPVALQLTDHQRQASPKTTCVTL